MSQELRKTANVRTQESYASSAERYHDDRDFYEAVKYYVLAGRPCEAVDLALRLLNGTSQRPQQCRRPVDSRRIVL